MQSSQTAPSVCETKLLSPRLVAAFAAVLTGLVAASAALIIGDHYLGRSIALGGHSESAAPIRFSIGPDHLQLPANVIRFRSQRHEGPADRLDVYLTWPGMKGYSEGTKAAFDTLDEAKPLLFLQLSESTMSQDMSGRYKPVYSHLLEDRETPGPFGLTAHDFKPDTGYAGETMLTAKREGEPDYVVRCLLPPSPTLATNDDCQRDIEAGNDLSITYRFPSSMLKDWQSIDMQVARFIEEHLENAPAESR